jgi:hypothetical protein
MIQFAHAACQSRFRAFGPLALRQWFLKLSRARAAQSWPRAAAIWPETVSGANALGSQSSGSRWPCARPIGETLVSPSFLPFVGGGGGALRSLMRSHSSSALFSRGWLFQRASADALFFARFSSTNLRSLLSRDCFQAPSSSFQKAITVGLIFLHLATVTPSILARRESSSGRQQPSVRHAIIMSWRYAPCSSRLRCRVSAR